MDNKDDYKSPELTQEEGMEIDWAGYAIKLKQCWRFIAVVAFIASLLGVVVALVQKRTYTVSVMLAPESQNKTGSSSLSSLTSILGVGGASLNTSSDALNITLFPEISQSV
ncbi:MAG: hypothetical protein HUJ98_08030, partial [Bacteroidaceae bacterium]|nr:hypothetical protein [Bacteroidaceae bacterium]